MEFAYDPDFGKPEMKTVDISFDVDIKSLSKEIAKKAEEALVKKLCDCAEAMIFTHRNSYGGYRQNSDPSARNGLQDDMKLAIVDFMEKNKDEIIERTAENLTKRLASSKKGKAILDDISNGSG